jgi:hypothetical protein
MSVAFIALAKKPDHRFPRCADFARALKSAQIGAFTSTKHPGQPTQAPTALGKPATATAPMTSVGPAAPSTTDSVIIPPEVTDAKGPRSLWRIAASAIVAIFLFAAAIFVFWPREQNRATNEPSSAPTSVAPTITFDGMRDFVEGYYADLPAHPNDAWAKLDAHYQNQTGLREYVDFWATIQSVTVVSVSPRDATSVVARLSYVRRDGQSGDEDRWFQMVLVNGVLLLDESDLTSCGKPRQQTISSKSAPTPSS